MKKKNIFTLLLTLMITFLFIYSPAVMADDEEGEVKESGFKYNLLDFGDFKGTISEISGKSVKIDLGLKDGLEEEDDGKPFTVEKNHVPVARLRLSEVGEDSSSADIEEVLDDIELAVGDNVTSEVKILDEGDIMFMDSPYCEFLSKTAVAGGDKLLWSLDPVSSPLMGNAHLLTCYGHNEDMATIMSVGTSMFGILGSLASETGGTLWGSDDDSFIYLFDEEGERKWGCEVDASIFKFSSDENLSYLSENVKVRPDYKVYSDRIYFNTFDVRKAFFRSGHMITSGVLFGLNLETGDVMWHLKDSVFGFDPVLYGLIYDNFIDKVCYLYSDKSSLYAVDLTNGEFLWEYAMHSEGIAEGVFDEAEGFIYAVDKDGYFYKVEAKTGNEVWQVKTDGPALNINHSKEAIYLFDNDKFIYAVDQNNGAILWKYSSEDDFDLPQENFLNGDLIYTFLKNSVTAVSKDTGKVVWKCEVEKASPLSHDVAHSLYCISDENKFCAIDISSGSIIWSYETEEEIGKVLPVKDAFYIFDSGSIYILDKVSGKELLVKNNFPGPVYLKKQEEIDPYNITKLIDVEEEQDLVFIGGTGGFLAIDPATHTIITEQSMDEALVRALGVPGSFYFVSENHIWAVDSSTGTVKWDKPFEAEILFIPPPADGEIYYDNMAFLNKNYTIESNSKKLLGLMTDEGFFILDRETGEVVTHSSSDESVYPYLELEAMNKVGEEIKGVYFYYYMGYVYAFRGK